MDDYTAVTARMNGTRVAEERARIETLQAQFSLIKVKVLLVSLLNGFRDLTLSGLQAFDFNHLNNVLVSRDYRRVHRIDCSAPCTHARASTCTLCTHTHAWWRPHAT